MLTRVLRLARQGHGLRRTIDRGDIGVAGHSLGAITTLGVAANSCCLDRRIDAASEWSGALLPFPPGSLFPEATRPFLFVHGESDGTLPYGGSAAGYAQAPAPKAFLTLEDAPHVFFFDPWLEPFVSTTADFFDGFLKGERRALRRMADRRQRPRGGLAAGGPRLAGIRGLLRSRPIALRITGSLAIGLPRPGGRWRRRPAGALANSAGGGPPRPRRSARTLVPC